MHVATASMPPSATTQPSPPVFDATAPNTIKALDKVYEQAMLGRNAAATAFNNKDPQEWWRAQDFVSTAAKNLAVAFHGVTELLPSTAVNKAITTDLLDGVALLAQANTLIGAGYAGSISRSLKIEYAGTVQPISANTERVMKAARRAEAALRDLSPAT